LPAQHLSWWQQISIQHEQRVVSAKLETGKSVMRYLWHRIALLLVVA